MEPRFTQILLSQTKITQHKRILWSRIEFGSLGTHNTECSPTPNSVQLRVLGVSESFVQNL